MRGQDVVLILAGLIEQGAEGAEALAAPFEAFQGFEIRPTGTVPAASLPVCTRGTNLRSLICKARTPSAYLIGVGNRDGLGQPFLEPGNRLRQLGRFLLARAACACGLPTSPLIFFASAAGSGSSSASRAASSSEIPAPETRMGKRFARSRRSSLTADVSAALDQSLISDFNVVSSSI